MTTIDAAVNPSWNLTIQIPVGGNPGFPTEFTDPNGPTRWQTKEIAGTDQLIFDPDLGILSSFLSSQGPQVNPVPADACVVGGYSDWFVNRIWIDPVPVAFGNIIGAKQIVVDVLSTFRYDDRIFSSVDLTAVAGGVSLLSSPLPVTLKPQGEVSLTFEAASQGDAAFDADAIFSFDHRNINVQFTGRRVFLFWFPPENEIREQLAWKTAIVDRRDGTEYRQSIRTTPRQRIRYNILAEDDIDAEATELRTLLMAFRSFLFGFPVWFELREVTAAVAIGNLVIPVNTVDIDHRNGGTILVFEPGTRAFFDATIATFTDTAITLSEVTTVDISAEALIVPVRFGYMTKEPQYDDRTNTLLSSTVEFETIDNVDLAFADQTALEVEYPVHPEDSLPILSDPNILPGATYRRAMRSSVGELDKGLGVPQLFAKKPVSDLIGAKRTRARDLAAIRKWRSILHWLRGSWGSFYLPTFRNDLPPLNDFQLNAGAVIVADTQLAAHFGVKEPHRSLMLELPDGRQFFARIATVTQGINQESLTLVNSFGATTELVTASTARISFLELVRIDGDVATLVHERVGNAAITFRTRTLQE